MALNNVSYIFYILRISILEKNSYLDICSRTILYDLVTCNMVMHNTTKFKVVFEISGNIPYKFYLKKFNYRIQCRRNKVASCNIYIQRNRKSPIKL